jgi:uncharacterized protein YjiS (DUF1127 family)
MHTQTCIDSTIAPRRRSTPRFSYLRLIRASMRRILAQWQRHRRAGEAHAALRAVDPRTLRDLGFHPSELSSVAAEMAGVAEPSRERVIRFISRRA